MLLPHARRRQLLEAFPRLRIGLLGDLFLDRYLLIEPGVEELSIETGLEAYQIQTIRNAPGALGTVINNLVALGVGKLLPLSVVGDDGHGYDLLRALAAESVIDSSLVLRDPSRLTPTYTKPMRCDAAGRWQELNRLDFRTRGPLANAITDQLRERLRAVFSDVDGWIILDQINEANWGVVNRAIREELLALQARFPQIPVLIDSRMHLGDFAGGILKGNQFELARATGWEGEGDVPREAAEAAARQLAALTAAPVFCTLGGDGILVAAASGPTEHVPGIPLTGPLDTVGAGDSVTSGILTALLAGATPAEAAALGNLVASLTVQQLGTTGTASPQQLLDAP